MSLTSSIGNGLSKAGNFVKKLGTRGFRGGVATATASAIAGVLGNPLPALGYFGGALMTKGVVTAGAGHIIESLGNTGK